MTTPRQWAEALLSKMGAPVSGNNIAALVAWAAFEGGNWADDGRALRNPLNTTQQWPGSTTWSYSKIPIQMYDSWAASIDATIHNLEHGPSFAQPGYDKILIALRDDSPPEVTLQAVKESAWGTTALDPNSWKSLYNSYANREDNSQPPPAPSSKTNWGLILGAAAALAIVGAVVTYAETGKVYGYRLA